MIDRLRSRVVSGSVLALVASSLAAPLTASAKEFVVKLNPEVNKSTFQATAQEVKSLAATLQMTIKDVSAPSNLMVVDIDESKGDVDAQLKVLLKNKNVKYAVPNIKLYAFEDRNDPRIAEQWALAKINAEKAWDISKGSMDVVVAVIDSGIDWKHEDLKTAIWKNSKEIPNNGVDDDHNGYTDDVRGWDFLNNRNDPMDEVGQQNPGHGTHCAGIIGAVGDNGIGVSGIAKVTLMPVRFIGADGSGDLNNAAKAIRYAVDNGANIISASWGAAVPRDAVKPILDEIEYARDHNVLFVVAAANDGKNNDNVEVYPANAGFENVISVAASDSQDGKPQWSNFGKATVDLAAPGKDIMSTIPGGYRNLSGTSMATPLVAGTAALVVAKAKATGATLKPAEVKAILQASGATVDIETACHCRIDAAKAVEIVQNKDVVVVPNALMLDLNAAREFATLNGAAPFHFASSDENIAAFEDNKLVAKAKGKVTVTVTDAEGHTAQTRDIYVGKEENNSPNVCKEPWCIMMCQIMPTLPFCPK